MEKFKHEQYRDQLAKDLKGVENHEERSNALESEKEGWRYKLAKERHTPDLAEKRLSKVKEETLKELYETPIEEIIQSHPEIAEKIQAIRLKIDGLEVSLVREKTTPERAFAAWSKPQYNNGSMGTLYLNVPESRLPEGQVNLKFISVIPGAVTENYGLGRPVQTQFPKHPDYNNMEGGRNIDVRKAMFKALDKRFGEDIKKWEESEEGKKSAEWHEEKRQGFKQAMQDACVENGIKCVVLGGQTKFWNEQYGAIEGVEMMDMRDVDGVRQRLQKTEGYPVPAPKEKGAFSFEL